MATAKQLAHIQDLAEQHTKHGQCRRPKYGGRSPEYIAWDGMIQRCTNSNSIPYEWYGARGIAVCERWRSFENFLADMPPRPKGLTLERVDNERGYEPGNCVWATRHRQMRNTRYVCMVDVGGGEMLCVRDAAIYLGVPEGRIYWSVFRYGITHQAAYDKQRRIKERRSAMAGGGGQGL